MAITARDLISYLTEPGLLSGPQQAVSRRQLLLLATGEQTVDEFLEEHKVCFQRREATAGCIVCSFMEEDVYDLFDFLVGQCRVVTSKPIMEIGRKRSAFFTSLKLFASNESRSRGDEYWANLDDPRPNAVLDIKFWHALRTGPSTVEALAKWIHQNPAYDPDEYVKFITELQNLSSYQYRFPPLGTKLVWRE